MSAKARAQKAAPREKSVATRQPSLWERGLSPRAIYLCFAIGILLFYWEPLFNPATSIQWDAVDVHYSAQRYFSESILSGKLPFWTPYVFSGMPFLADPQVGAWYPLNWPFFLLGITPKAIQWETALHCLIAVIGAFLLAIDLVGSRWAAAFCGLFYGLSGFFAAHSSHTGIFQAAAVFPWLLWTGLRAASSYRWLPAVAVSAGVLVLVGHFQTALYGMCALVLLISTDVLVRRGRKGNAVLAVVAAATGGLALSAVMSLPGLELTLQSERASSSFGRSANAVLAPGALLTLVNPNHFGAPKLENYTGPEDVTQFYWYQGILLVPLALAGLTLSSRRWHALALIVPVLWYAVGPAGGLYSLVSQVPGLRQVRSPVHGWFIVSLGLALLAAGGVMALLARFKAPRWVPLAVLIVAVGDVWYWNMHNNRLAYARQSYYALYGFPQERFARVAASAIPSGSLHRLWAASNSSALGPLNGALDTRTEVTYGYNPLELTRYARYLQAANNNPKLLDSLAVTAKLNPSNGLFVQNPTALPRVSAPPAVSAIGGMGEAERRIATLDPSREALAEGVGAIPQNGPAELQITHYEADLYTVKYRAARATLIRLAVPYFPGWRAEIDGRAANIVPLDLALMGVIVPEGSHEVVFRYRSNWFGAGAAVSALAWLAALFWLGWSFRGQVRARPV